jgi:hypothetical protein
LLSSIIFHNRNTHDSTIFAGAQNLLFYFWSTKRNYTEALYIQQKLTEQDKVSVSDVQQMLNYQISANAEHTQKSIAEQYSANAEQYSANAEQYSANAEQYSANAEHT